MSLYRTIAEADIDSDFEYNFDLKPFNTLLDGVHWLITTPVHAAEHLVGWFSARLRAVREAHDFKRTIKGPVCMLK